MNHDDATTVEIRAGIELPATREEIELHTADGLTLVGELATAGRPAARRDARDAASAADGRRVHGLAHPPQGGRPAARPRRPRGAALQHARHDVAARHERGRVRRGRRRAGDLAAAMDFVARARAAAPVARRLVVRHRARAQVRPRARHRGRHPALAAAAPHEPTRSSPRGRVDRRRSSRSSPSSTTTCDRMPRPSASRAAPAPCSSPSRAASTCGWGRRRPGACSPRSSPPSTRRAAAADRVACRHPPDAPDAWSALVLARDHDLLDDEQDAAATGIAMSAPRRPSSDPPASAAITTTAPGTETARFMMRGTEDVRLDLHVDQVVDRGDERRERRAEPGDEADEHDDRSSR